VGADGHGGAGHKPHGQQHLQVDNARRKPHGAGLHHELTAGASAMNIDTITIILAILGTGAGLVPGQRDLKRSISDLRERMARLEGLFDGYAEQGN